MLKAKIEIHYGVDDETGDTKLNIYAVDMFDQPLDTVIILGVMAYARNIVESSIKDDIEYS